MCNPGESLMANLSCLKGSSDEFGKISVTEDYTKNEREGGPELHLQNFLEVLQKTGYAWR